MQLIVSERGEAIHLHDGEASVLEIRGQLHRIEGPRLNSGDVQTLFQEIAPNDEIREAENNKLASFEFRFNENTSFRMMFFQEDGVSRIELRKVL
jgi:Tfp pilus assembly pilus retraction ATPase PilT